MRKALQIISIYSWMALFTASGCLADTVDVTLPGAVTFNVTNYAAMTSATVAPLTASYTNGDITPGWRIRLSMQANAATFDPPGGAGSSIDITKVEWLCNNAVNGTGYEYTLSNTAFREFFVSNTDATSGSVDLYFILNSFYHPGKTYHAGAHTLTCTYKVESGL